MIKCKSLAEAVKYGNLLSKCLRNYAYPHVTTEIEEKLIPFRTWSFPVDGYNITIHITEFNVNDAVIQNIQVFARNFYCLPFHVCFKVAVAFMGTDGLVNFTVIKQGHIVSCWTRMKEDGDSGKVFIRPNIKKSSYLGIDYGYL